MHNAHITLDTITTEISVTFTLFEFFNWFELSYTFSLLGCCLSGLMQMNVNILQVNIIYVYIVTQQLAQVRYGLHLIVH